MMAYSLIETSVFIDFILVIPRVVLQMILSNNINNAGRTKMTRSILIIAPLAMSIHIELMISMSEYSNFVVQEEAGFYSFFIGLAMVWSGLLFMVGTLVTHQFTLSKTIFSLVVIIVGMGVIAFIGLLFFNLIQQMYDFVSNLYYEYSFRI